MLQKMKEMETEQFRRDADMETDGEMQDWDPYPVGPQPPESIPALAPLSCCHLE